MSCRVYVPILPIMWRQKLNLTFYKYRGLISSLFLLLIGYFIVYTQVSLPPMTLFLGWHPDTQLRVLDTIEEQYRAYVQPGDIVVAIDGQLVQRGEIVFPPPVKSVYEFTLQREQSFLTEEIVVGDSNLFWMWEMSKGVLALFIWLLGFLTMHFARPNQWQPLYVGGGFQLIAAGIVSPGPAQFGAPGGWIVGQVLVFYFPQIMLYLSVVPRHSPLPLSEQRMLRGSFYVLSSLALMAVIEELFLFPEYSWGQLAGIRSQTVLTLLSGASMIGAVTILSIRLLRSPHRSYERQQLTILFVFLALALLPLFVFVIAPIDQTVIFAPFPFIYSIFLLAPAGYFFVLHRQGYLELDAVFSRVVTVAVLLLAIGLAYATGVYLLDAVFQQEPSNLTQGVLAVTLFGVAAIGQKPLQSYVDLLIYGRNSLDENLLQEIKTKLSAKPEPDAVTEITTLIATHLFVQKIAVLVQDKTQFVWLAGNTPPFTVSLTRTASGPWLRIREPECLSSLPAWVDLLLPITVREETLGLLVLSRPANGYFNNRQVQVLQEVADALAFGLLVINLVETMQALSRQTLYEKEIQRQQIATEIHNEPLHALTTLIMQLQADQTKAVIPDAIKTVRQVSRELRRIIVGLRPPVLQEDIGWMTRQMAREFNETYAEVKSHLDLDICSQKRAPETTKMAFYYIFTEALNNVIKHAQATTVNVAVYYGDDELRLIIQDDGIGPGVAVYSQTELLRQQHIGIADMHRWALVAGGRLKIEARSSGGTTVRLVIPSSTYSSDDI